VPIPTTFLDTCRTRVLALPEYAAFVAAGVIAEPALRPARDAQWGALYGYWGGSIAAVGFANLDFLLIPSTLITGLS